MIRVLIICGLAAFSVQACGVKGDPLPVEGGQ